MMLRVRLNVRLITIGLIVFVAICLPVYLFIVISDDVYRAISAETARKAFYLISDFCLLVNTYETLGARARDRSTIYAIHAFMWCCFVYYTFAAPH
ncbi:hypothetical protein Poli38472_010412 [Pythium oligandrum]|uniref:Uncharacterized protein n=1 Tax=Pythium oligandrum TaxID=41045 RepID=A0A8K1F9S4_PYTOL|nr:hypothetical protein Poli38472_010412 [Pythium oligandrum]|eukprot:TMW55530.1 hypothetical protein Poli38472_010412 [Pythium oligandrum]